MIKPRGEESRLTVLCRVSIAPEDIIVSVNQLPVDLVQSVATALNRSPDRLLLNVRRGNSALFIVIQ